MFDVLNKVTELTHVAASAGSVVMDMWEKGNEYYEILTGTGEYRVEEPAMVTYPSGVNLESDKHSWIEIIQPHRESISKNAKSSKFEQRGKTQENVVAGLALPFPQNIQLADSYQWSGEELGVAQGLLQGQTTEQISAVAQQLKVATMSKGAKFVDNISGMNAKVAMEIKNQKIRNMNLNAMFRNVQFRQFAMSFDFAPRSEQEVRDTIDIIRRIRAHAAVDFIEDGTRIQFPGYFNVEIRSGEALLISHGKCAATGINVNYTPDGIWATFRSGFPVHVTMDVSFMETEIVTRSQILKGER